MRKEGAMPVMEISVVPLGTGSPSVSRFVAGAVRLLREEEGIAYEITAMGTIVEAEDVETLLRVAAKLHRSPFEKGAQRVVTTITIDDRRDKKLTMAGKIASVRKKLQGA